METNEIDSVKLNEALDKFGSLQKAIQQMEQHKLVLEKQNSQFKQENDKLSVTRNKLASQIEEMGIKVRDLQNQLQSLANKIEVYSYQYELFCGFIAMVVKSPSVTYSIDTLIILFQKLKEPGWYLPKSADEMRSLFVHIVMGDYLKCFRCDACGAKFIINQKPKYKLFGNGYECPACQKWYGVKEDDSLLKALVSGKQLEDTQHLGKVLEEYNMLEPFKAFLNVPCEMCHRLVKEWDDYNVKLAIEGTGCGHTSCWNSQIGQWKQLGKAIQKFKKDMK
jgi:predicted RNA-binding Zn-ribbon protein involved in translation (DUF1610 family)